MWPCLAPLRCSVFSAAEKQQEAMSPWVTQKSAMLSGMCRADTVK